MADPRWRKCGKHDVIFAPYDIIILWFIRQNIHLWTYYTPTKCHCASLNNLVVTEGGCWFSPGTEKTKIHCTLRTVCMLKMKIGLMYLYVHSTVVHNCKACWLFFFIINDADRLIMIAERDDVYSKFPIPLINRLEKHYLVTSQSLSSEQRAVVDRIHDWVTRFSLVNIPLHQQTRYVLTVSICCFFFCNATDDCMASEGCSLENVNCPRRSKIGHFQVVFCLCFKMSPKKISWICMKMNLWVKLSFAPGLILTQRQKELGNISLSNVFLTESFITQKGDAVDLNTDFHFLFTT